MCVETEKAGLWVGCGDGFGLGLEGWGGGSEDSQAPGLCTWMVLWNFDVRNTGRRLIWGVLRFHDSSQHNFKCLKVERGAPEYPSPRVISC